MYFSVELWQFKVPPTACCLNSPLHRRRIVRTHPFARMACAGESACATIDSSNSDVFATTKVAATLHAEQKRPATTEISNPMATSARPATYVVFVTETSASRTSSVKEKSELRRVTWTFQLVFAAVDQAFCTFLAGASRSFASILRMALIVAS